MVAVVGIPTSAFSQSVTMVNTVAEFTQHVDSLSQQQHITEEEHQFYETVYTVITRFSSQEYDSVLIGISGIEQLPYSKSIAPWLIQLKVLSLMELNLFDEAAKSIRAALVATDSLASRNKVPGIEDMGFQFGSSWIESGEYRRAIRWYLYWLNTQPKDYPKVLSQVYHNLGISYLHLEQFDSAQIFLDQPLNVMEVLNDTVLLAYTTMDLANLCYVQYLDDQAIPLFEQALAYAKQSGDTTVWKTAELNMAVVEENRKDYAAALAHRKEYERLLTAEWNRDRIWALAEQQKEFAIATKQQEVDLLAAQRQQQEAELARRRTQQLTLSGIAGLLLLVVGIVAWSYRQLQGRNQ
ncbi:MAG TPA: hypothetical protein DCR93_28870, partial [Cytophagales bacterium]|nr:hypothetical protein [Cytophagales bacterium]